MQNPNRSQSGESVLDDPVWRRQRLGVIQWRRAQIKERNPGKQTNESQIAFTFYVIALAAKVAFSSDTLKSSEQDKQAFVHVVNQHIDTFTEIFGIESDRKDVIRTWYKEAVFDSADVVHYANQLMNLFADQHVLLEELIEDLVRFADVDEGMDGSKVKMLKVIAQAFHLNDNLLRRVLFEHLVPKTSNPFELLGVNKFVSYVDLKRAYRLRVRDCHPDTMVPKDTPQELIDIAKHLFERYQHAFEQIKRAKKYN